MGGETVQDCGPDLKRGDLAFEVAGHDTLSRGREAASLLRPDVLDDSRPSASGWPGRGDGNCARHRCARSCPCVPSGACQQPAPRQRRVVVMPVRGAARGGLRSAHVDQLQRAIHGVNPSSHGRNEASKTARTRACRRVLQTSVSVCPDKISLRPRKNVSRSDSSKAATGGSAS